MARKTHGAAGAFQIRGSHEAAMLRVARAYLGIGQEVMAAQLDIGVDSLRRMEAGNRTIPLELLLEAAALAGLPEVLVREGIEGFVDDRVLRDQYAKALRSLVLQLREQADLLVHDPDSGTTIAYEAKVNGSGERPAPVRRRRKKSPARGA